MRIAIVGRKDVGKTRFLSALLEEKYINQITVDFHEEKLGSVILIDTPAYDVSVSNKLMEYKPDVVWILIDGSRSLTSLDLECIQDIRRKNVSFEIIVGFGKDYVSDLPDQDKIIYATTRSEIDEIREGFEVSQDVEDENKNELTEMEEQVPEALTWLVIGRENAGKSTLVNKVLGYDRVLVSDVPGTTQKTVQVALQYEDLERVLKDTAGVKNSNVRYVKRLLEKRALVIFVIDATKELTHSDKHLLGEIMESGLSCVIALNKADDEKFDFRIGDRLSNMYKFLPIVEMSGLSGENVKVLLKVCKEVEQRALKKLPTSILNKWVEAEKHLFHGTKIKYAVHTSTSPYVVSFFVSPMTTKRSVISHLRNLFQKYFDLKGVCVKVLVKASRSSARAAQIPLERKIRRKQMHESKKLGS